MGPFRAESIGRENLNARRCYRRGVPSPFEQARWPGFNPRQSNADRLLCQGTSRITGGRSSGHLCHGEGRSRGHFLVSMRRGACESTRASRCTLIIVVRKPAGLTPRAENRPSCSTLRCGSQQCHGLRRLCTPCHGVVGPLSIPTCRDIGSEAHLFLRHCCAMLAPPKWIKRLREWRRLHTAIHK